MYGLGEHGEMTALATGDDRLLIMMLLIYFIFRGIRNKKLGEVKNFQVCLMIFFSKGQKPHGGGRTAPPPPMG